MPPNVSISVPSAPENRGKKRVLYAEDQTSSRTVTTALLQRLGYDVDAVEDGELAVACARKSHYDIILLDIEMPVMDGVTAARMIRSEDTPCKHSPIVALSAFLADSTEFSQWRDAFDSALPKPANSNELKNMVAHVLATKTIVPDRLYEDLQAVLPRGAWGRLATNAADEMHALALTLSACVEQDDLDNALKASKALATLANNFGAVEVVRSINVGNQPVQLTTLFTSIYAWKARNAG
jgi:CheY-like chemotaxis protein